MPPQFSPEIRAGLISLRSRIRRIRFFRGLMRTASVGLVGLLVIVGLDYFLAPLPSWARVGLFFTWLAGTGVASLFFMVITVMRKLPLVRLARWLEERHPELQERISTALELSDRPDGVSPALLSDLAEEAAADIGAVNPSEEVDAKRVRPAMWPAAASLVAIGVLAAVWPQEMGRLLTRAVLPFSELGNAGAFRFAVTPGDLEVMEGDEFTIELTYDGSLDKSLELVVEKDGEIAIERLTPEDSEGDKHRYAYTVHSAQKGFKYSARVAGNLSDRFEVKVYPLPRLLEPVAKLKFPSYTGWQDREVSLGGGVQALAGTEVTISGRLDTPVNDGEVVFDGEVLGEVELDPSARGTEVIWRETLTPGQDGKATLTVKHRLGRELEAAKFGLVATLDPAPEVEIFTPLQREFRVKPNDQVTISYGVIEAIGIANAEIELEVNGKAVEPFAVILPEPIDREKGSRWEGDALVHFGDLVDKYPKARELRMRLKMSDNRPKDLEGPGVGYSEWLAFRMDRSAESLARQELRNQDEDLKKTVEEVVNKVREAKNKMHQAKGEMHRDEVTEKAEKALAEAREKLKEAQAELADLSERMKEGVQEHRRDDVEKATSKLEEAQKAVENAPLQDTPEARREEVEHALRESEEAINDLRKLRQEVDKDRPKIDDLAKLQEMAQRQEELARDAAKEAPNEEWQRKQREMQEEIRNKVRQSPEAKAAAIRAQSEQALDLAKEAESLKDAQEQLSEVSEQVGEVPKSMDAKELGEALAREQNKVSAEVREEWADAKKDQEKERAADLAKAEKQTQKASKKAREGKTEDAAKASQEAAEKLAKEAGESPTQKSLAAKQEKIADAFEDLAQGRNEEAREALDEIRETPTLREVGKALAEEQKKTVSEAKEELAEAKAQNEERAEGLAKAVEEAEKALAEARHHDPEKAAESAKQAAENLKEGGEESPSQKSLQKKQEKLAEAFEALAEGDGEEAQAALEEAQGVPRPEDVAKALAEAQKDLVEKMKEELATAQDSQETRAEDLGKAVEEAQSASNDAQQNKPEAAAESAAKAAAQLAKGSEQSPSQQSLQKEQEALAEAFEALAEGNTEEALATLEEMQSERLNDALEQALAREQEAIVEGAKEELAEAREAREERANDLPEALAQAQAALENAKHGDAKAAAESAQAAAAELAKGGEASESQQDLQERQEGIAEALADLAEGRPEEALAALQELQSERAEELAEAIRTIPPVEGNPFSEAGQLADSGAQKAMQASDFQQDGKSELASQKHEAAADQFARAKQALESASQLMEKQAMQASQQSENPNKAPAPGKPMAEALQKSSQAAQSGKSGQQQAAASQAQAAAEALRQAAQEAMSNMKQGGKPSETMAQSDNPGEGEGEAPPADEAKEGVRSAQGDKGVPPELAKLGINIADWEKIQASLKTDVSGARGSTIPEDYRGLVQKYFEQISKKQ